MPKMLEISKVSKMSYIPVGDRKEHGRWRFISLAPNFLSTGVFSNEHCNYPDARCEYALSIPTKEVSFRKKKFVWRTSELA